MLAGNLTQTLSRGILSEIAMFRQFGSMKEATAVLYSKFDSLLKYRL